MHADAIGERGAVSASGRTRIWGMGGGSRSLRWSGGRFGESACWDGGWARGGDGRGDNGALRADRGEEGIRVGRKVKTTWTWVTRLILPLYVCR